MDTHGNVPPAQVHGADITLLWRTNPHMDCRDRGLQLAKLIAQTVRGEIQPVQAVVNPPMGANILAQNTADEPMRGLLREALEHDRARRPGCSTMSIGEGFPYADVPHMGMALVAVADRDVSIAQKAAEELARRTWEQRQAFDPRGVSVADAVRLERRRRDAARSCCSTSATTWAPARPATRRSSSRGCWRAGRRASC